MITSTRRQPASQRGREEGHRKRSKEIPEKVYSVSPWVYYLSETPWSAIPSSFPSLSLPRSEEVTAVDSEEGSREGGKNQVKVQP